jgi:hypothetical protein
MNQPCTNCGAEAADVYCARCGEKQPSHHDLTMGHFTHDAVHELVHLDSKLFQTLKLLAVKPGLLTAEYFAGRKKRYISPIRLFLTLFALQFIAFTVYKPAAVYEVLNFTKFDASGNLQRLLERKAAQHKLPLEQHAERINHRWQKNLSMLQLVNIMGMAAALKLLYAGRKRFFVEHLVFSAHYLSFTYLFGLILVWPIYALAGFSPGPLQKTVGATGVVVHMVYLYFAQRRFYGQSKGKAIAKTILLWIGVWFISVVLLSGALIAAIFQYR